METLVDTTPHQADPLRRRRLRWRSRRGLLENDLILQRFLDRYELDLSDADVTALTQLLDLTDDDLFDLLLEKSSPEGALATPDVERLLVLLRAV
jgi:antitoxin CptB